jgi:hypothetical protein
MPIAISPNFTLGKLANPRIDDKIDVFEDQVRGWLFEPARIMTSHQHAGFAILTLCLSYFEPIGQFLDGKRRGSEEQFTKGLDHVFSPQPWLIKRHVTKELYDQLRCGMFHTGITKGKVLITGMKTDPITVHFSDNGSVAQITVQPWELLSHIEKHLSKFIAILRDPANEDSRTKFEARFETRGA